MPSRRANPFQFVNIHGQPLGEAKDLDLRAKRASAPLDSRASGAQLPKRDAPPHVRPADALTAADMETVFDALVVAGWQRGRTALANLLRALEWRRENGRAFSTEDLGRVLPQLALRGRAVSHEAGEGWSVPTVLAEPRLATLLAQPQAVDWWRAWLWVSNGAYGPIRDEVPRYFSPRGFDEAVALMRLVLICGDDAKRNAVAMAGTLEAAGAASPLATALAQLQRLGLGGHVNADVRWQLLGTLGARGRLAREPELTAWVVQEMASAPAEGMTPLRLHAAEHCLHRGQHAGMVAAIGNDAQALPFLPLLQALWPAREGRFAETVAAFPPAWKALCAHVGRKRGFVPDSLLQWYPLALMAEADAMAWTSARKFCLAMSGSRQPSLHETWGRWVHALGVRLGDARLDPAAFNASRYRHVDEIQADPEGSADKIVLAAWLGHAPAGWTPKQLADLSAALVRHGRAWKADLLAQSCERLGMMPPRPSPALAPAATANAPPGWPVRYFAPRQAAWRDALAAITALGESRADAAGGAAQAPATLRWRLTLDAAGRVFHLEAFEPSASGRGKPKLLSLAQLKKRARLDPRDAAVLRCVRQARYGFMPLTLDLVQAAFALVGHPAVELADAPGTEVELQESLPMLDVRRERTPEGGECFVFRLHDELLSDEEPDLEYHVHDDNAVAAEALHRDSLRIVRESPERARLIRITAAQRRVAELVAQRWAVPAEATAELDAALRVLAGHFVLHSDAAAGEPVASDARLVAQLQPRGDAMRLLLAVRPFGEFGPLLTPGQGRARLMTLNRGVSLATERDLEAERRHLSAVLEALPFLGGTASELPPEATWPLDEPEHALAAVHELGRLAGEAQVLRALEWPKGHPLRVFAPQAQAFGTTLKSGRDWFALEGGLQIDEQRVLSLQQLLGLLREARGSRYVALGNGEYLALAEQLRQRLAELAALGEAEGEGVKLGATAAAWLAEAAPGLGVKGDTAWQERAAQLERAAALEPEVPAGLQATLRPYQTDGYVWMRRLAEAGFGAILADDMGLGKTVQTLALLLARAGAGPALVVAPTSVCSNWADEAARFAPALRASVYGQSEVERATQIAGTAAGDLLIVSYALLLRDAEAFAAHGWATLVLDEAQALKNAATLRVQAVAGLKAGFRLALSGTPVENRLADLWSIMNLLNPGLLGNAARFAERFANPIERQRNEAARARLRRLVGPFLLRRTKAQVLTDLPPRTEIIERVQPQAEEQAFLEAMRRAAVERIAQLDPADNKSRFNVLAELTRLRRAACDPRLAAPELGRIGAKVQAFERLATELVEGRHQALVFSQFTDFLKLLAERLDARGLRYQYLDGSTPAAVRGERVAAFQRGEADLFLISLKAGGFGLNLTAADYVVIADPWWNPAAEDQAMGRAHRIGQQRPVTVYRLVTAGSIEERIVALHHDKRELAEGLLAGQDGGAPLAASDLMDLLRE